MNEPTGNDRLHRASTNSSKDHRSTTPLTDSSRRTSCKEMQTVITARTKPDGIVQDKFQIRPNLSFSGGLRFDYHGGLTEKNGRIFNFDPSRYSYDPASDTITSNGFIVAGNNPDFPTKGVSDSTLTGRQWGLAPRVGLAWSPRKFNDKVVVRAGWGLYYDRGELFTYLSPGFASGVIAGGPFGVNQTPPWVNSQTCSPYGYSYCSTFEAPWGTSLGPAPSGNPAEASFAECHGDLDGNSALLVRGLQPR